jgi:hypothetical protein
MLGDNQLIKCYVFCNSVAIHTLGSDHISTVYSGNAVLYTPGKRFRCANNTAEMGLKHGENAALTGYVFAKTKRYFKRLRGDSLMEKEGLESRYSVP